MNAMHLPQRLARGLGLVLVPAMPLLRALPGAHGGSTTLP